VLPACLPTMQGIALPETGNMVNISMGVPRHKFNELPEEIKSEDPKVLAKYLKENFKAFKLDYEDFATQWAASRWNRTSQVHCNLYHSSCLRIVIMGDAAHATSPSIGMGMNTALRDASAFNRILGESKEDLVKTLPAFSEERVKEGNALTDLAMHLNCMCDRQQQREVIHTVLRLALCKVFPSFVSPHPQGMIGQVKHSLSEVYDQAVKLGIIAKQRAINDKIRRDYFEKSTGMVKEVKRSWFYTQLFGVGIILSGAAYMRYMPGSVAITYVG
jgi:2-polyprenyl-6-methoxyphenol hydroxylase-like FAD-dependent oxidoreductase